MIPSMYRLCQHSFFIEWKFIMDIIWRSILYIKSLLILSHCIISYYIAPSILLNHRNASVFIKLHPIKHVVSHRNTSFYIVVYPIVSYRVFYNHILPCRPLSFRILSLTGRQSIRYQPDQTFLCIIVHHYQDSLVSYYVLHVPHHISIAIFHSASNGL